VCIIIIIVIIIIIIIIIVIIIITIIIVIVVVVEIYMFVCHPWIMEIHFAEYQTLEEVHTSENFGLSSTCFHLITGAISPTLKNIWIFVPESQHVKEFVLLANSLSALFSLWLFKHNISDVKPQNHQVLFILRYQ